MCAFGTNRQPRGAALVIAMLVMAVLLLAGTTFLTISSTESQIALNERVSAQAMLLAEAAMHKAIARLNEPPLGTYTGETNTALGSGTFTVTFPAPPADQKCPASTAKNVMATAVVPVRGGQAQVKLQATVDQISYPFRWGAFATVPNGVIGGPGWRKELWLGDNSTVDSFDSSLGAYSTAVSGTTNVGKRGNIGANADVTLDKDSTVQGNVTAGGDVDRGPGVTMNPSTPTTNAPSEPFPSIMPSPPLATGALSVTSGTRDLPAGTYSYTSMTLSSSTVLTTSGGPVTIYVTGALTVGNNVTLLATTGGPVVLYVTGAVNLGKRVVLGAPGTNLRVIAKSAGSDTDSVSFIADDNFTFYGSLYGKNTDINLGDDADIYGSVVARTIKTNKRATIHFDQAMSDQEVCYTSKFNIRRGTWREVIPST